MSFFSRNIVFFSITSLITMHMSGATATLRLINNTGLILNKAYFTCGKGAPHQIGNGTIAKNSDVSYKVTLPCNQMKLNYSVNGKAYVESSARVDKAHPLYTKTQQLLKIGDGEIGTVTLTKGSDGHPEVYSIVITPKPAPVKPKPVVKAKPAPTKPAPATPPVKK